MSDNRTDNSVAAAAVNLVTTYVSHKGAELTPTDIKNLIVDVIMGIRTAAAAPLPTTEMTTETQLSTTARTEPLPERSEPPTVLETQQPAAAAPEKTVDTAAAAKPAASIRTAAKSSSKAAGKTAPTVAATVPATEAPAKSAKTPAPAAPKVVKQPTVSEAAPAAPVEAAPSLPSSTEAPVKAAAKARPSRAAAPAKIEPIKPVKMTKAQAKDFAKEAIEQPEATSKAELDKKFGRRLDVSRVPFEGLTPEEALTKEPGYVLSLFDGVGRKMISRYLRSEFGMTENEYRLWWGLPADYPMTSPGYSGEKSDYAKEVGLGTSAFIEKARAKKGDQPVQAEAPAPVIAAAPAPQETVAEQPTPKSERVVRSRPQPAAQKKKSRATA
ncbi:MucR family transcriptional regulator [Rhizobium leguminosarum]|uniref:MucR family transcriptional regulator n=1 Tax=Rhizobium leguminosarum TaxID=384 RepID=UPI002E0F79ED|nr:MucR family transcriptional regulator [Rhizobium leguminosarum]WSH77851.1 MucR family transcriptional regulator [Rhizobium leguminosarum]